MPHLRLEYSSNVEMQVNRLRPLFLRLHDVLVSKADAKLSSCQSRAICCENFCVGDGEEHRAFVYLQVFLLEGRSHNQLQETGNELLRTIQDEFKDLLLHYESQISVHLNELPLDRYYKSNHSPTTES